MKVFAEEVDTFFVAIAVPFQPLLFAVFVTLLCYYRGDAESECAGNQKYPQQYQVCFVTGLRQIRQRHIVIVNVDVAYRYGSRCWS